MSALLEKAIVAALLFAVAFTVLAHGAVEPWATAVFELTMVAVVLLWGAKAIADGKLSLKVPAQALPLVAMLGLALVQSVAITNSEGRRLSLSMDVEATRATALMILLLTLGFLAAANFFATEARLRLVTNFLTLFGLAVALFALIQHFSWNGRFYWLRPLTTPFASPFGPFVNRNHFAGLMEMLIPLPLGLALSRATHKDKRLFYLFAAAMMAVSAVVSLSRGGLISIAAQLVFIALVGKKAGEPDAMYERSRRGLGRLTQPLSLVLLMAFVVAAGVAWIGPQRVIGRLARTSVVSDDPEAESFFESRGWIWRDTLTMIAANPISGVGLGAYETAYPIYGREDGEARLGKPISVDRAHNDYLQALSDGGVIGGLIVVWFIWATARSFTKGLKATTRLRRAVALGCGAALFGMLIHSAFDFNLQLPSNVLVFLLLAGILSEVGPGIAPAEGQAPAARQKRANQYAFTTGVLR